HRVAKALFGIGIGIERLHDRLAALNFGGLRRREGSRLRIGISDELFAAVSREPSLGELGDLRVRPAIQRMFHR
ncbi:MAG: hypothetical protein QGG54_12770, partial [Gammaproteobacteria bacterium]|nr:hypothetical protein [Gammaproteobacteria bacterium]